MDTFKLYYYLSLLTSPSFHLSFLRELPFRIPLKTLILALTPALTPAPGMILSDAAVGRREPTAPSGARKTPRPVCLAQVQGVYSGT